jgi:two-component system chemotaxis response regulator CheY
MGQTDIIAEALKIGAKDYVIKPFQPQVVVDVIRRVLGI